MERTENDTQRNLDELQEGCGHAGRGLGRHLSPGGGGERWAGVPSLGCSLLISPRPSLGTRLGRAASPTVLAAEAGGGSHVAQTPWSWTRT